jgi:hypothetical protein
VLCDLYLNEPGDALEAYERYVTVAASPDVRVPSWITDLRARMGREDRTARNDR